MERKVLHPLLVVQRKTHPKKSVVKGDEAKETEGKDAPHLTTLDRPVDGKEPIQDKIY